MKIFTFETFNKVMATFMVAGVTAMVAIGVAAWAGVPVVNYQDEINTCSMAREYAAMEENAPLDGAFFSIRGVVDNIYYGTEKEGFTYYLIYDDVDAGLEYEPIRVDGETYKTVTDGLNQGREIYGTLKAITDYETVVYHLEIDEL